MRIILDDVLLKKYITSSEIRDNFSSTDKLEFQLISFAKGEIIVTEQEIAEYLYFIIEGKIRIYAFSEDGRQFTVMYSNAPEFLGDVEYSADIPVQNNVEAVTKVTAVRIPIEKNRHILRNDIAFYRFLAKRMGLKIYSSAGQRRSTHFYDAMSRLKEYIPLIAQNGVIERSLGEISQSLEISYRHLMRLMKQLCDEGALERDGKKGVYRIVNLK